MTQKREMLHVRLPIRLYKIIMEIRPLFYDWNANNPAHGATTRAVEHILQVYFESLDYETKRQVSSRMIKNMLTYMNEKNSELVKKHD